MRSETQNEMDIKYCYELVDGVSTYSYGIAVAKQAGLHNDIVKRAAELCEEAGD